MEVEFTTATLLTVTAPPCTVTVAGAVKLVPINVTFTVAPRVAELGVSEVRVGLAETGRLP